MDIYTSEERGSDITGNGTMQNPFKSVLKAMRFVGKEPLPNFYSDSKSGVAGEQYELTAKSHIKKVQKIWQTEGLKSDKKSAQELEDLAKREQNLQEAKKVKIFEGPSWPTAKKIKIDASEKNRGIRVKINGWIHRLRRQGKGLMFATLRDGFGFLQCVFSDQLCQTYEALILSTESSVTLYGTLKLVPQDKTAPGGHELIVDYWELIGSAPAGGADTILNEEAHVDVQLDNRHIMIRGENTSRILKMRDIITQAFRAHYQERG